MILKASQRSGAKQLGAHLLKTEENEHVEIHEVSGFVSDTVQGAMMEAYASARGTKCDQYLFSVSLNPPMGENVGVEVFEKALKLIEERNGLTGQPRVVVFHEKEGRRHCHAVWSRIDAETMTAKPLPFFKSKLRDIAKELYLEQGWKLPSGFVDPKLRDPRNFTLDEWQQAKRSGLDAKQLKAAAQECWAMSDNAASFSKALEERGLFLARGDRRGHVAVTIDGDVFAVSRLVGLKTKEVSARLGKPDGLLSVGETMERLGGQMRDRLKSHIAEAKRIASNVMKPLVVRKAEMKDQHLAERKLLDKGLAQRATSEQRERASRMRRGIVGAWDILTGRYSKMRARNEAEAFQGILRDRAQRDALVKSQLAERSSLQKTIQQERTRHATQVLGLYRQAAQFRLMQEGRTQTRDRGNDLGL